MGNYRGPGGGELPWLLTLVAAALEGRYFCGIEKNENVHLFKSEVIDYIEVARKRLIELPRFELGIDGIGIYRMS